VAADNLARRAARELLTAGTYPAPTNGLSCRELIYLVRRAPVAPGGDAEVAPAQRLGAASVEAPSGPERSLAEAAIVRTADPSHLLEWLVISWDGLSRIWVRGPRWSRPLSGLVGLAGPAEAAGRYRDAQGSPEA
jgi:hypothetical protein